MIISPTVARFICSGLGSGWVPVAPGTAGSMAATFVGWGIWHYWGAIGLMISSILLTPLACWACYVILSHHSDDKDPGWIVVDEWLGQWVCLFCVAMVAELNVYWFAACFIAFRILDIAKPWPIGLVERVGPPWWSIQADDLLAGAISGTVLAGLAMSL